MFHYKKEHPSYNVKDHSKLFVKDPDNVMFNQFGMYILSEIPKMQNMKSFAVHEHTNIDEFVREVQLLPDGTSVNRFSKELFSYLETLVAFSPYYKINDPLMVGPFDQYYMDTLADYGEVSYKTFHKKLAREMKAWYEKFPPVPPELETDDEEVTLGQGLGGDSAARAADGSSVRKAVRSFNADEDEDDDTHSVQDAQQSTELSSGVPTSKPAAPESAGTPPTLSGTNIA
jgi:hypothetical protein